MKIIPSSRKNRYIAGVIILLAAVALIARIASYGPTQYNLTISSTEGGEVTTPGERTFTYEEGTVVNLVAEADEGYQFVNWTGNVSAIADVNAAATNITMNSNYAITANFAPEISENLEIRDWYDLNAVRDNACGHYTLMNGLDSTTPGYEELASPTANEGKGWQPIIEILYPWGDYISFMGTFDGQGYEICDLFINRPNVDNVGLFKSSDGIIKNIGVVNATVTGDGEVGGLVGANFGTVSNSYSTGSVTGTNRVGGLVAENYYGTVSNSYSSAKVTGSDQVGGLVGWNNESNVTDSYSTGSVTGNDYVGGLVGSNGLLGSPGIISNSFWDIQTSVQATSDGGTGKTTAEMQDIATFSGAGWNITAVTPGSTNNTYIWNIVDDQTYPFLSWQS